MGRARKLAWFVAVAAAHFVVSVAGTVLSLRVAFDTQRSFWDAPVAASLAYSATILLAPLQLVRVVLPVSWRYGYLEIAVVSVLFGAAAVALLRLAPVLRGLRRR